eukprot:4903984-Alexandrium_andersonii.AAC.1
MRRLIESHHHKCRHAGASKARGGLSFALAQVMKNFESRTGTMVRRTGASSSGNALPSGALRLDTASVNVFGMPGMCLSCER